MAIILIIGASGCKNQTNQPNPPPPPQLITPEVDPNKGENPYETDGDKTKENHATEIAKKAIEDVGLENLTELNQKQANLIYSIDENNSKDYAIYVSDENILVTELAVVEMKDGMENEVVEALKERLSSQMASFKDYLPEQYAILENAQVRTIGNYCVLIVTNENEKVLNILEKEIDKK